MHMFYKKTSVQLGVGVTVCDFLCLCDSMFLGKVVRGQYGHRGSYGQLFSFQHAPNAHHTHSEAIKPWMQEGR